MNMYPKRRTIKENPYTIKFEQETYTYKLNFVDSNKLNQCIKINTELYYVFNNFELEDISQMNKFDRHIEHLEQSEESLYNRVSNKGADVYDLVLRKTVYENLKTAISHLPQIQKRRLIMYYFYDMTLNQIAINENCTHRAVKFSIDIAIEKLRKELKYKI